MSRLLSKRIVKRKLNSVQVRLMSELKELALKVKRAQEDLAAGRDLESRIMANSLEIDSLVSQYDLLRETLGAIEYDETSGHHDKGQLVDSNDNPID